MFIEKIYQQASCWALAHGLWLKRKSKMDPNRICELRHQLTDCPILLCKNLPQPIYRRKLLAIKLKKRVTHYKEEL